MAWHLSIRAPLSEMPVHVLSQGEAGEMLLFKVAHTATGCDLPRDPGTWRLAPGRLLRPLPFTAKVVGVKQYWLGAGGGNSVKVFISKVVTSF